MKNVEDQISITELLSFLWGKKIIIIIISGIFSLFAIFYSLSLPNVYQSSVILTISENQSSSSSGSSAISNITSSFGVDIGSDKKNTDKIAVSIMQSWGFADDLIKENSLEAILAASNGWDEQNNQLLFDDSIYDKKTDTWVQEKTSWELFQRLKAVTNVRYDGKDKFIYLSAESFSPFVAKDLVEKYVSAINEYMRLRQINQSNKNLSYLEAQLDKIKNNNLKQVFYELILKENREKMLAEANPEYMFVVVSRAMVPEVKSKPLRSIIVISISIVGFLLACLFVLFQNNLRSRKGS